MANGKPRHPLIDIRHRYRQVYSSETDELIRRVAALSNKRELYAWWDQEIGWKGEDDAALVAQKSQIRYDELLLRAKQSCWELPETDDQMDDG